MRCRSRQTAVRAGFSWHRALGGRMCAFLASSSLSRQHDQALRGADGDDRFANAAAARPAAFCSATSFGEHRDRGKLRVRACRHCPGGRRRRRRCPPRLCCCLEPARSAAHAPNDPATGSCRQVLQRLRSRSGGPGGAVPGQAGAGACRPVPAVQPRRAAPPARPHRERGCCLGACCGRGPQLSKHGFIMAAPPPHRALPCSARPTLRRCPMGPCRTVGLQLLRPTACCWMSLQAAAAASGGTPACRGRCRAWCWGPITSQMRPRRASPRRQPGAPRLGTWRLMRS